MRRPNFKSLIKDELVSRFESVVVDEVNEQKSRRESIENRFHSVELELRALKDEFHLSKKDNEKHLDGILERFLSERNELLESFDEQHRTIRNLSNLVKVELESIKKLVSQFAGKTDLGIFENHMNENISFIKKEIHQNKEELLNLEQKNRAVSDEFLKKNSEDLRKLVENIGKTVIGMTKKIDEHGVTNQGVLKELQVYKKNVFVLEKKIEDLYNQVDRLKKK